MKNKNVLQFPNDWEYTEAKRQERKRTKESRQQRRNKHQSWQEIA